MTQTSNRLMDEFAKLMNDAASVAQGARREVETAVRHQFERFIGEMDLVQRDEVDAVSEMAANARRENEELRAEIGALEARLAKLEVKPSKAPAAKRAQKPARKATGKSA
jgi:BMFP domain-containing protein YqiC